MVTENVDYCYIST